MYGKKFRHHPSGWFRITRPISLRMGTALPTLSLGFSHFLVGRRGTPLETFLGGTGPRRGLGE